MVRCERCDAYVSRDYARVFGDNEDAVATCPNCQAGWDDGTEDDEQGTDRKLTFRMSEFDSEERADGTDDASPAGDPSASEGEDGGRFGRVGRAVSGLF